MAAELPLSAAAAHPRTVAGSIDELLDGAYGREPFAKNPDSLSGSRFERVIVGGEPCVIKYLGADDDWVARATGDVTCRNVDVWQIGLLDRLPPSIDHAILGCARWQTSRGSVAGALLLRDVGELLVPEGSPVGLEQHLRFLDHMATMHADLWGFRDTVGLTSLGSRYLALTPGLSDVERARGGTDAVPVAVADGWRRLRSWAPRAVGLLAALAEDPSPLLNALDDAPTTLVHGDWKFGNLGSHPDGRTVLIDWAWPGEAAACVDLAWYLAVNCDRLPQSKEDTIASYRAALRTRRREPDAWSDDVLSLCLLGAFLQLGWSKTLDNHAEIGWWEDRALEAARLL